MENIGKRDGNAEKLINTSTAIEFIRVYISKR